MEISLNKSLSKVVKGPETKLLVTERANILVEIKKVKSDLADAYNNFDYVDDSLMIDYYTYQIKAFETRFEYLIKKAKALGIIEL